MFKVADLVSLSVYQSDCRETKSTAFNDTFILFIKIYIKVHARIQKISSVCVCVCVDGGPDNFLGIKVLTGVFLRVSYKTKGPNCFPKVGGPTQNF